MSFPFALEAFHFVVVGGSRQEPLVRVALVPVVAVEVTLRSRLLAHLPRGHESIDDRPPVGGIEVGPLPVCAGECSKACSWCVLSHDDESNDVTPA